MQRSAACVLVLAGGVAVAAIACAPRRPPATPTAPRFPDYVYPSVPSGLAPDVEHARHEAAWQALQVGDLDAAERGFRAVLARAPSFYPAETGLGYVALARESGERAVSHFERALAQAPAYAPALAGKGEALVAADRLDEALASFEAALAADGSLSTVRRRVEVLRFHVVEREVARAREAADAGKYDTAREAYERALAKSPDSAFLHRALASVERALGRLDRAREHALRAVELDPDDAQAFDTLGEVEAARGDHGAAVAALERAYRLDPSDAVAARLADARARARLAHLPAEFRAIATAPVVTRGDLAALVAVHLGALLDRAPRRDVVFVSDARTHWAASFILAVTRAGVMEVYPDYTFQPGQPVTRGELAQVVSRLLAVAGDARPDLAERWRRASVRLADVPPGHLGYPAVALAVASGAMTVLEGNTFQPSRRVTGAEATAVIDRVGRLFSGSP